MAEAAEEKSEHEVNPPLLSILPNGDRLLTLPEVAAALRVSVKTVRRLIEEGRLKAIKVRGAVRVWLSDLMAFLQPQTK